MKKMNNKGFSLVELIIVIAIMAILAAAIAPALIRYIDKSRKANDVTAAGTVATAVEAALANEDCYDYATSGLGTAATTRTLVNIEGGNMSVYANAADTSALLYTEISNNLSTVPKIKYKKNDAQTFVVATDSKGGLYVYIGKGEDAGDFEIQPSMCGEYK